MISSLSISVIITTYNWPQALSLILKSLSQQKKACHFEVIIADDGSDNRTKEVIESCADSMPFTIKHVWQPDQGFQAAKIRNKAAAHAIYDYLVFLDGDCVPRSGFIQRHFQLAEKKWFVSGNRILLQAAFSKALVEKQLPFYHWSMIKWIWHRFLNRCNRILPLLSLPANLPFRKRQAIRWQGAKTCNLGVWRSDFLAVNGFDETFKGWGYEDSDLVIRLIRSGVKRKQGHFAIPVLHCWHPEQDRSREKQNSVRLQASLKNNAIKSKYGIDQYLGV